MIQLLPLAIQLAGAFGPTLASMLIGPKAGEVSKTVVDTVEKVFGTSDPATVEKAIQNNPALAQVYIEQIKADTERYKDSLADIAGARAQAIEFAKVSSPLVWGAPVVSTIVVCGFIFVVTTFMIIPTSTDPVVLQTIGILFGYLGASLQQVVSYWVGSSAGSHNKDALLGSALMSVQNGHKPTVVVPKK